MRKIGNHFKTRQGRPAFHFSLIYADEWPGYGFPAAMTIHQRNAWSYLFHRTESHRCSVSEVSRKVWGSPNHRKTAKETLEKLEKMKLAGHVKGRWFSIFPPPPAEAMGESGKSQSESCDSGGDFHDSGESQKSQSEFQKPQSDFPDSGGESIDSLSQGSHPSEFCDSGGVSSRSHQSEFHDSQRDKRQNREKETTTTMRDEPDLEKYIRDVLKIGVDEAISIFPDLYKQPLQIPNEEINWFRFVAVGVAVAIDDIRLKNQKSEPPRKTSVGGLIHRIAPQFRDDDERAKTEIENYLSAKDRVVYLADKKAQETKQAKRNLPPSLPPRDEARDSLKVNLEEWLEDRFPELSRQVKSARSTTAEHLEYLRIRADRLQERFSVMWEAKGSRNGLHAEHVRKQYLQEIWIFTKDLKGVMA